MAVEWEGPFSVCGGEFQRRRDEQMARFRAYAEKIKSMRAGQQLASNDPCWADPDFHKAVAVALKLSEVDRLDARFGHQLVNAMGGTWPTDLVA